MSCIVPTWIPTSVDIAAVAMLTKACSQAWGVDPDDLLNSTFRGVRSRPRLIRARAMLIGACSQTTGLGRVRLSRLIGIPQTTLLAYLRKHRSYRDMEYTERWAKMMGVVGGQEAA